MEQSPFSLFAHAVRMATYVFLAGSLSACAGPTTPFGAIHDLLFASKTKLPVSPDKSNEAKELQGEFFSPQALSKATISFYPERQLLHKTSDFKVKITDPEGIPSEAEIKIFYQEYDVTETFKNRALHIVNIDKTELTLEYNHLRLLSDRPNHVRFVYRRQPGAIAAVADYLAPYCSFDEMNQIHTLGSFTPPKYILKYIEHWSMHEKVNPTLIAGLVAQESSFDTRAVSWAKAIGLTQVTNIADLDLARGAVNTKDWPRSEAIRRYPATVVKGMISAGKITAKDDYRLDPEKSVRGGLLYIKHLETYWRKQKNYQVLQEVFGDPELAMTEVILASYNSGAARVKKALKTKGVNYLNAKNLTEAKKYVRNINSYCFHFGQKSEKGVQ